MGLRDVRGKRLYRLMKFVSGMSFCMYGYDASVLGGFLLHPPFQDAMGNPTGVWTYPMIIASYDLAAFFTSIIITSFTLRIGRRGTILMGNAVAVLGALLQASAYGIPQMMVGRVATGFAIGSISSSVPSYLNECGQVEERGPAHAVNAMLLLGGVPLGYWIDYGFVNWHSQASWRIPVILQCVFAISAAGIIWFLPDTPRWYYARGRIAEGDAALCRLNDVHDISNPAVADTKKHIMTAIEIEREASQSLRWTDFLTMGFVDRTELKIIRRLVICFWVPMLGEWMGISLLAYFAPVILQGIGVDGHLISLLSGVITTAFFVGTIPTYWTIERYGRRFIMLWSAVVSTVLFTAFIICVAINNTVSGWVAIGLLFPIICVQTHGWQATKFLYSMEIAPLEYRHIGAGFFASGEWLMVFITVMAGPIGLGTVGWPFWFFILSGNVLAIIFVYLLCPETKGKTLEEIDYLFIGRAFAGLRRTSVADIRAQEDRLTKGMEDRRGSAARASITGDDEKTAHATHVSQVK